MAAVNSDLNASGEVARLLKRAKAAKPASMSAARWAEITSGRQISNLTSAEQSALATVMNTVSAGWQTLFNNECGTHPVK